LKRSLLTYAANRIRFEHENVAKLYICSFQHKYMPALVSPFYPNGNIMQYLAAPNTEKTDADILLLVQGIARGLEYLHKRGIVHGDIRGVNSQTHV